MYHDFFINPNLTDADLQIIINDARSKIVQLYAYSYEQFYAGFQILQQLSMSIQLEQATEQLNLSKEQQESDESRKSSESGSRSTSIFNESDDIYNKIASKSSSAANEYKNLQSKLNKKWSDSRGTSKLEGEVLSAIRRLIQQGNRYITNVSTASTSEISEETIKAELSHELARIDNDVFKRGNNAMPPIVN
jgi:phosphoenolpyruvate carboxylase